MTTNEGLPEELELNESFCIICETETPDVENGGVGIILVRCQKCYYVKERRLTNGPTRN